MLIAFAGFYLFVYLGRFNFWPVAPLIKQELQLTYLDIGIINAFLLWGFCLGDLVHGRLSEIYGFRVWVLLGAIFTTILNWATSFGISLWTIAIPYGLVGFVNAACWSPAISMISQWWPRRERGLALGIVGTASGAAMLLMWWVTGWIGVEFGWRYAFRYPPIVILLAGIAFFLLVRDRPTDVNLPEYSEDDPVSAVPEAYTNDKLKGLGPYKVLLSNPRFHIASHVKGLENVVKYGLTTWIPIYYFEVGGHSFESTVMLTALLPLGYLIAPPLAGIISDRFLNSNRRPMIMTSCGISAFVLFAVAIIPPTYAYVGAALLLVGGISIGLSPIATLAVDIAGRKISATASGLLDAHGYAYAGLQAIIFSLILGITDSPWILVFTVMGMVRILSLFLIYRVRA